MTTILQTFYHLDQRKTVNWSTTQEKTISQEFPFSIQDEDPEQYVQRTYLQFLWLPDTLMPLHLLIPSLRRVDIPSTSDLDASTHPYHALLDPLLLSTQSVATKYHTELPKILINNGGGGGMEETMMWYAVSHEKLADDQSLAESELEQGPWTNDKWREAYLERMERREVQIQILLYLYKISLPGPPLPTKKPRKRKGKSAAPVQSPEERLEAFMDKLSMWQLVGALDHVQPATVNKEEDRDWTQVFAEDSVERCFNNQLPILCSLLRSKLFPHSAFSDDDEDDHDVVASKPSGAVPRQTSPNAMQRIFSGAKSRQPSPALSSSSRVTNTTLNPRAANSTRSLLRSRSRSLSVSLAQEQQERDRASNIPSKKRILNREVSMSRVFKPKPKPRVTESARIAAPSIPKPKVKEVILVEETPQKPRIASTTGLAFGRQPSFGVGKLPALFTGAENIKKPVGEGDADEEWVMDSSPNIVLLTPMKRSSSTSSGLGGMDYEDDDDTSVGQATPSKPCKARLGRR